MDVVFRYLAERPVILIFLVIGLGAAIGRIRVAGPVPGRGGDLRLPWTAADGGSDSNSTGHRDRTDDPFYRARRTLRTGADLLTDRQKQRVTALFATEEHAAVEAIWGVYQRIVAAYREPDRGRGRDALRSLIYTVSHGVPGALREIITLGRTLKKRAEGQHGAAGRPASSRR